jgi:hypothetical protein
VALKRRPTRALSRRLPGGSSHTTVTPYNNGSTCMGSSGKKKTTMAKLDRERRMRERRMDKQARKDLRKLAASDPEAVATDEHEPVLEAVGSEHAQG